MGDASDTPASAVSLPVKTAGRKPAILFSVSGSGHTFLFSEFVKAAQHRSFTAAVSNAEQIRAAFEQELSAANRSIALLFLQVFAETQLAAELSERFDGGLEPCHDDICLSLAKTAANARIRILAARVRCGLTMLVAPHLEDTAAPTAYGPRFSLASNFRIADIANVAYNLVGAVYAVRDRGTAAYAIARKITDTGAADYRPMLQIRLTAPIWDGRAIYAYWTSILRLVDGVLSALGLALVRLRSDMARWLKTPTCLLALLATDRRHGHLGEPDPWALPLSALRPEIGRGAIRQAA